MNTDLNYGLVLSDLFQILNKYRHYSSGLVSSCECAHNCERKLLFNDLEQQFKTYFDNNRHFFVNFEYSDLKNNFSKKLANIIAANDERNLFDVNPAVERIIKTESTAQPLEELIKNNGRNDDINGPNLGIIERLSEDCIDNSETQAVSEDMKKRKSHVKRKDKTTKKSTKSAENFHYMSKIIEKFTIKDGKKKKKKSSDSSSAGREENGDANSVDNLSAAPSAANPYAGNPPLDDEGYVIRPNFERHTPAVTNSFNSSTDSDSDEEKERKIHIKIKPLSNGAPMSASVDELIASAGTLSLSPITHSRRRRPTVLNISTKNRRVYTSSASPTPDNDGSIKRSFSANHNISKTESDLLGVFGSSMSSASTSSKGIPANEITKAGATSMFSVSTNAFESSASADRYAAFAKRPTAADHRNSTLAKSVSTSIIGVPITSSIPRPPSKRNNQYNNHAPQLSPQLSHQSDSSTVISRCESASSIGSSDFRMTPISVGSSRGPSPLTLGMSDVIPVAIALQESVSACFKGNDEAKCQVQMIGCLKMAFPAGIVQVFANNPHPSPFTFNLNKSSRIEKIFPNKELLNETFNSSPLISSDKYSFEINMPSLVMNVRRLYEQTPNSRYYNIDILKYQIRAQNGAKSTPLQLVSYWKCEPQTTGLKIDYKYNSSSLSSSEPLKNVTFSVNLDGGVSSMQSKPAGKWNSLAKQAIWRFDQISPMTDNNGLGSVKAKFDVRAGPSTPAVIQAQFQSDTTMTGVEFELTALGYRLSLVKKQLVSGRYICEAGYELE